MELMMRSTSSSPDITCSDRFVEGAFGLSLPRVSGPRPSIICLSRAISKSTDLSATLLERACILARLFCSTASSCFLRLNTFSFHRGSVLCRFFRNSTLLAASCSLASFNPLFAVMLRSLHTYCYVRLLSISAMILAFLCLVLSLSSSSSSSSS